MKTIKQTAENADIILDSKPKKKEKKEKVKITGTIYDHPIGLKNPLDEPFNQLLNSAYKNKGCAYKTKKEALKVLKDEGFYEKDGLFVKTSGKRSKSDGQIACTATLTPIRNAKRADMVYNDDGELVRVTPTYYAKCGHLVSYISRPAERILKLHEHFA